MTHIVSLSTIPDLLSMHERNPERYPCLLESVAKGTPQSRYDILFYADHESVRSDEGTSGSFLKNLDRWFDEEREDGETSPLPFTGGWFLYLGYELAQEIEPSLETPVYENFPVAFACRSRAALIIDHEQQRCFAVAESQARGHLARMLRDADFAGHFEDDRRAILSGLIEERDESVFLDAVEKTKAHIAAGDIFQANLSRRWHAKLADNVTPGLLYKRLRETNPAPFACLAVFGDKAVVSSSPERLLEIRDGQASTRPIAGTRPRGDTDSHDFQLSDELIGNEKERAEHVMLIDLERNDLGRICEAGSVHVDEMMIIESYSHVHHIVSNVRGKLREDVSPGAAIAAVFPGGTITGCPKVRCMEIIGDLEDEGRGPYTGSIGYLNRDGSMDLNILIRTLVLDGKSLSLRAGGGIVADSEPEKELAETRAKARGMLLALEH